MSLAVASPAAIHAEGPRRDRFWLLRQAHVGPRASNLVAIVMLFCLEYWLAHDRGERMTCVW